DAPISRAQRRLLARRCGISTRTAAPIFVRVSRTKSATHFRKQHAFFRRGFAPFKRNQNDVNDVLDDALESRARHHFGALA
ncbi:MAG TPA: hypothetical protein VF627_01955, partial [Abditibacterium sp.]